VTKAGAGAGTVTSSPAGITCGSTCVAVFSNGTSVTLTARAGARSRFQGWSGDCSGRSSCVLSMTANHSVKATFARALAPATCLVPNVVGKSLGAAMSAIVRAHCKLGKVTRVRSSRAKKGKVVGQSPGAGRRLANGAKVNLAVGKGR
jgi:PASTA domain-containing protein/List-Bact-rpt repeat protein